MIGVIIGRFQPLHNGHIALIEEAKTECDDVFIVIGSSNIQDDNNPYTLEEREQMIKTVIGDIKMIPLEDVNDDDAWVASVIENVPPFDMIYSGDEKDLKIWKHSKYQVKHIGRIGGISGTEIRKKIVELDESWKKDVPESIIQKIEWPIRRRSHV